MLITWVQSLVDRASMTAALPSSTNRTDRLKSAQCMRLIWKGPASMARPDLLRPMQNPFSSQHSSWFIVRIMSTVE